MRLSHLSSSLQASGIAAETPARTDLPATNKKRIVYNLEFAGFQSYKVLFAETIGDINTCDFLSSIQHKGLIFYTFFF